MSDDDPTIEELRQQLSDAQDLIDNTERGMGRLRADLWAANRELAKFRAAELVGELTNAGTMRVSGEENRTGYFVACTVEELRAVKQLPMYRRVAIVPLAA